MDSWTIAVVVITSVALVLMLWWIWRVYTEVRLVGVPTDLNLYQGKWYEQMRVPSWFENSHLQNVTAEYKYDPQTQTMQVINSGVDRRDGQRSTSIGTARPTGEPGRLGVKFFPLFPEGSYVVLSHDCGSPASDYECAVVGSDDRDYLWFLTRQPNGWTEERKQYAIQVARKQGYTDATIQRLQQVTHDM